MPLFFKISSKSGIVNNTKGICNDLSAFYFEVLCVLISYIFSAHLDTVSFIVKMVKYVLLHFFVLEHDHVFHLLHSTVHFCSYNLQIKGYCQEINFLNVVVCTLCSVFLHYTDLFILPPCL